MKKEHIVSINQNLCISCGLCKKDCPNGVIDITENGAEVMTQNCIKCGHCVAICPKNAVSISGFEDKSEEITSDNRVDYKTLIGQLKARRSMRQFINKEVPMEMINQIIEAGRYTPSGSNKQTTSYVVLKENINEYEKIAISLFRKLKKIIDIFTKRFRNIIIDDKFLFKKAPVAIVIKSTDIVDGALATSSMELIAQSLGLGVLYSGFFTKIASISPKLKNKLKVNKKEKIVMTLVIGYPAVKYKRTAPKEEANIILD